MSKAKKTLTSELQLAVAPYLATDNGSDSLPPAVTKALRKLAKEVTKQRSAVSGEVPLSVKQQRRALRTALLQAVRPYLASAIKPGEALPKKVTKSIKKLAFALVEQRLAQPPVAAAVLPSPLPDPEVSRRSRRKAAKAD